MPAPKDPEQRKFNARIANASRWGKTEEVEQLKREQRMVLAERHIREWITTWPPLTDEQRAHLAALLSPETAPRTGYKPNPMYAWIGQKRKAAARRLEEARRLTAEADAMEEELKKS